MWNIWTEVFKEQKKYRSFTFTILSEYMFFSLKFGFCLSSVLKMCLTSVNRAWTVLQFSYRPKRQNILLESKINLGENKYQQSCWNYWKAIWKTCSLNNHRYCRLICRIKPQIADYSLLTAWLQLQWFIFIPVCCAVHLYRGSRHDNDRWRSSSSRQDTEVGSGGWPEPANEELE